MKDHIVCRYCKKEVDIDFEEQKGKKGKTYWRGKCPSCGKANIRRSQKKEPEEEPEEEEKLPDIIENTINAIFLWVSEDIDVVMSKIN